MHLGNLAWFTADDFPQPYKTVFPSANSNSNSKRTCAALRGILRSFPRYNSQQRDRLGYVWPIDLEMNLKQ